MFNFWLTLVIRLVVYSRKFFLKIRQIVLRVGVLNVSDQLVTASRGHGHGDVHKKQNNLTKAR